MDGACVAGWVNIITHGRMSRLRRILLNRSAVSYSVRTTTSLRMPLSAFLISFAFLARMAGAKVSLRKKSAVTCTRTVKIEVTQKIQRQLTPCEMYAPQMGATQGLIQVSIP